MYGYHKTLRSVEGLLDLYYERTPKTLLSHPPRDLDIFDCLRRTGDEVYPSTVAVFWSNSVESPVCPSWYALITHASTIL